MSQVEVSSLSKVYRLYPSPRAFLKEILFRKDYHEKVRALQDISFKVEQGESFGLVGPNGAGKTTLLKILSGTTLPSTGQVKVAGNVASLLELGAGFHPEYTGRQNIYSNGALMGLSRSETRRQEENIIEFSELGKRIDQPVKTYSSGMYLRLGFSVATSYSPKVLILDEIFAVGDQRFQKKCTDRMNHLKEKGCTTLFCSHNLQQVRTICERALWLNQGCLMQLGPAHETVDAYLSHQRDRDAQTPTPSAPATETVLSRVEAVQLTDGEGKETHEFRPGDTLRLSVGAYFSDEFQGEPTIGVALVRNDNLLVCTTSNTLSRQPLLKTGENHFRASLVLPSIDLLSGTYYFNVFTTDEQHLLIYDALDQASGFEISHPGIEHGLVRLRHRWEVDQ